MGNYLEKHTPKKQCTPKEMATLLIEEFGKNSHWASESALQAVNLLLTEGANLRKNGGLDEHFIYYWYCVRDELEKI